MARVTDANVYLVIDRSGKSQIYRSTDRPGWPPSEEKMVRRSLLHTKVHASLDYEFGANILQHHSIKVLQTLSPRTVEQGVR